MLLIGSNEEIFIMSAAVISEIDDTRTVATVRTYSRLYSVTDFSISTHSFDLQRLSWFVPQ